MAPSKNDLPRKLASFYSSVRDLIKGKKLCVCLSGGADSVSLLFASKSLAERFGFELCACHFNHMIRGEEADRDENFCRDLCERIGVKIYCGRDDVPSYAAYKKLSTEEAARECRYAFFERLRSRYAIDYHLTAHTMNDDAETLLLNLIRGSGANGASSIARIKDGVMRPMLLVSREEVEKYLSSLGQEYVTDSTNNNTEYTRNYIRNELFPILKELNPNVVRAFSRYVNSVRDDREFLDELTNANLDSDLRNLHKAVRTRVILRKYKDFAGIMPNSEIVTKTDKAIMAGKKAPTLLTADVEARTAGGILNFSKPGNTEYAVYKKCKINMFGITDIFKNNVTVCSDKNETMAGGVSETKLIELNNVKGDVYARQRLAGDKIRIKGVNRSLKKLVSESKIPLEYRNIIPVFYDTEGIIYVPFVAVSDRVFTKQQTDTSRYVSVTLNSATKERWKKST